MSLLEGQEFHTFFTPKLAASLALVCSEPCALPYFRPSHALSKTSGARHLLEFVFPAEKVPLSKSWGKLQPDD